MYVDIIRFMWFSTTYCKALCSDFPPFRTIVLRMTFGWVKGHTRNYCTEGRRAWGRSYLLHTDVHVYTFTLGDFHFYIYACVIYGCLQPRELCGSIMYTVCNHMYSKYRSGKKTIKKLKKIRLPLQCGGHHILG